MADSPAFIVVADQIEKFSELNRLQARGMIRLVLKEAGLKADSATAFQMMVVANKLLEAALKRNGMVGETAATIRENVVNALSTMGNADNGQNEPEAMFSRLSKGG